MRVFSRASGIVVTVGLLAGCNIDLSQLRIVTEKQETAAAPARPSQPPNAARKAPGCPAAGRHLPAPPGVQKSERALTAVVLPFRITPKYGAAREVDLQQA